MYAPPQPAAPHPETSLLLTVICWSFHSGVQALGPLPGHSTNFLLAFDVTERDLAPSAAAAADGAAAAAAAVPTEAVWRSLQELLAESEGQAVHGNQLVAVLKQLQHVFKRWACVLKGHIGRVCRDRTPELGYA